MISIGIVGTKKRDAEDDYNSVKFEFINLLASLRENFNNVMIIRNGCEEDADRFAKIIAEEHDISMETHYPDWDKYGKNADAIRNVEIAKKSDYLIACVSDNREGGTEITIHEFVRRKGNKHLILV